MPRLFLIKIKILLFCITLLFANSSLAETNISDKEIEPRLVLLYEQVKCPTCQGQSIKDSNTRSAVMMRYHIAVMVKNGLSDDDILNKIRSIYGEHAVSTPTISSHNFFLWLAPLVILFVFTIFAKRSITP